MTNKRNRTKQIKSLEERLMSEAKQLRQQAAQLPPGIERDRLLRKARQDDTAAYMATWIGSPGLRSPE